MSVNKLSMARVAVGSLLVGSAPGKKNIANNQPSPVEIAGIRSTTATINPGASIAANSVYQTTFALAGVQPGDAIIPIPPAALEANLDYTAFASAANTVTVRIINPTIAAVTTASRSWSFLWVALPPNN